MSDCDGHRLLLIIGEGFALNILVNICTIAFSGGLARGGKELELNSSCGHTASA